MQTWSNHLYNFYLSLKPPKLPAGIDWLYPQKESEVQAVVRSFLHQYYNDTQPRRLLLGINPGRYGAGVTGVNFTAPKQLTEICKLKHPFKMQSELSAEFIYAVIEEYGGPDKFYSQFFISSVCPFGFVKAGKNINYYDDVKLLAAVSPFIISAMKLLLQAPFDTSQTYCIGEDKNYKYLTGINDQQKWFDDIVPLPHPRFIMQYKRKQVSDYVKLYVENLKN